MKRGPVPNWLREIGKQIERLAAEGKLTGGLNLVRMQEQALRSVRTDRGGSAMSQGPRQINIPFNAHWGSNPPEDSRPYLEAQGIEIHDLVKVSLYNPWTWYYACILPSYIEIVREDEDAIDHVYLGDELLFDISRGQQPAVHLVSPKSA